MSSVLSSRGLPILEISGLLQSLWIHFLLMLNYYPGIFPLLGVSLHFLMLDLWFPGFCVFLILVEPILLAFLRMIQETTFLRSHMSENAFYFTLMHDWEIDWDWESGNHFPSQFWSTCSTVFTTSVAVVKVEAILASCFLILCISLPSASNVVGPSSFGL